MIDISTDLKYKDGLIPVIAQDYETKSVLMFAYTNAEALELTKKTGIAHYYSRQRNKIWKKGELSGHYQTVCEIRVDCDCDCILYIVKQTGCACHMGYFSCFYRNIDGNNVLAQIKDPKEIYSK